MSYRGVIFDFNGVLLWDAALQEQSWKPIARLLRGHELTAEELAHAMHGRTNASVLSYLAGRPIEEQELQELIQRKESFYRQLCLDNPSVFVLSPGARELLDALAAKEIPRTIATSSESTNLHFFIAHLNLRRWFDPTKIIYDDGVRPGKPAPHTYREASERIGLAPEDCVVVEDAFSGLQAAHAARIGYIVAMGPAVTHEKLRAYEGVSEVIESLEQFPQSLLTDSSSCTRGANL